MHRTNTFYHVLIHDFISQLNEVEYVPGTAGVEHQLTENNHVQNILVVRLIFYNERADLFIRLTV